MSPYSSLSTEVDYQEVHDHSVRKGSESDEHRINVLPIKLRVWRLLLQPHNEEEVERHVGHHGQHPPAAVIDVGSDVGDPPIQKAEEPGKSVDFYQVQYSPRVIYKIWVADTCLVLQRPVECHDEDIHGNTDCKENVVQFSQKFRASLVGLQLAHDRYQKPRKRHHQCPVSEVHSQATELPLGVLVPDVAEEEKTSKHSES